MIAGGSILIGILRFWDKLPSPIKVLIYLFIAFACGFIYGTHKSNQKCEMEKQASIAEAVRIDGAAKDQQVKNSEANAEKYKRQNLEAENKLADAATQFSKLAEKCRAEDDFIKRNNDDSDIGDGLSKPVPSGKKRSTPR